MPSTGVASPVMAQMSRRGAVAAAEQHEVDPGGEKFPGRDPGVFRRRFGGRSVHDLDRRKARRLQGAEPHVARNRQPAQRRLVLRACEKLRELPQGLARPRVGGRRRAPPHGLRHDGVGALEPDAAAHAGNRIDEEAYLRHRARVTMRR
jgi:hypothetical protein